MGPFSLVRSLIPLPKEKIVSEKKGESVLVHLDFHSGKKRAVGRKRDAFPLIYIIGA